MPRSARAAAVTALIPAAAAFPDLPIVEPELDTLSDADARLATAIHRTVLQRWITLEHLLNRFLKRPTSKLAPETRAVFLSAAAQLIFMDRLPAYAVIDESVKLIRTLGQPRAAGMVNAVLRKIADSVIGLSPEPWTPAADRLPRGSQPCDGHLVLQQKLLPNPDNLLAYLAVATSHPLPLLQRWFKVFGRDRATELALHSLGHPATYVIEQEKARRWGGSRQELTDWLAQDPDRRVQDPASLESVAALASLNLTPRRVLDLCAGRGTKTRQLRALYPQAQVTAYEPDEARRVDLQQVPGVRVESPGASETFDLVLLDVPCSNTGVLARRPGARYRAAGPQAASLIRLQREILDRAIGHLAPQGHLLYCTCSIDPSENQDQAAWLLKQLDASGKVASLIKEATMLPRVETAPAPPTLGLPGSQKFTEPAGHDGSYHAVIGFRSASPATLNQSPAI
ncbi:MAG: transcription antitermination factor NusB [Planctomycetota bacterium]